jgi:hypothetical protein
MLGVVVAIVLWLILIIYYNITDAIQSLEYGAIVGIGIGFELVLIIF